MTDTTPAAPPPAPRRFETTHSGVFHGNPVDYTCIASETHLPDADGKPRVSLFSFSYLATADDPAARPVTFVFNGGPGSASLWLHMGAIGPRIIKVPSDAKPTGSGPYTVIPNTLCNLDQTDLVFIDPPGTGYSTMLGEAKYADVWGLEGDAEIIAQFIKAWLTAHKRWASPRYLCGESYGTTRAITVAGKLSGGLAGVAFNGIALISTILDFHTARFEKGNVVPDVCFLPTFAATALYHGKITTPLSPEAFLDEVRDFAASDYLTALFAGSRIDEARRVSVRDRLAAYTGLSPDWLDRTRLRIEPLRFRKELLRDRGQTVGRLDSRYLGTDHDHAGEAPEDDPSSSAIDSAFVSSVNDHLTRALGIDWGKPYQPFNAEALKTWTWPVKQPGETNAWPRYVNVAPILARLLRDNPTLKVLVANGLYDMATPFYAVETTMAGNGIDRDRLRMTYYAAGHMMYLHDPSLEQLMDDLRAMVAV
jgi:carboxypeptidase C (cathepsin A)